MAATARKRARERARAKGRDESKALGISILEVAKRINKSRATIYKMINRKKKEFDPTFPRPFKIGWNTRFDSDEIDAWYELTKEANRF